MSPYLKFCQWLGVSPRLYLGTLIIGFLGSISCLLSQKIELLRDCAFPFLLLAASPLIVVQIQAFSRNTPTSDLIAKSICGTLFTFFIALIPGAGLGMFLGSYF